MKRTRFVIGIVLGLLVVAPVANGTFLRNVSGVITGTGKSYLPILHRDSKGSIYLAWIDARRGKYDLYLARSLDEGRTWSAEETWIDAAKLPEVESTGLALAEGRDGALHAVWHSTYAESDVRVMHAVSRDRGATWSSPRTLNGTPGLGYDPKIASDGAGHLYVTWHEQRPAKEPPQEKLGFKLTGPQEFDIFFTASADDGQTWLSRPIRLNPRPSSPIALAPQIGTDGNGHVYVLWREQEARQPTGVYVAISPDHGRTWPVQGVKLNRGNRPADAPSIAFDRKGHLVVAWNDLRHGAYSIYFTTSPDHGRTWLPQDLRLGTTPPGKAPSFPPQISISDRGEVYVTWIDTRHSREPGPRLFTRSDVYFTKSSDRGKSWLAQEIRLNTNPPGSAKAGGQRVLSDGKGRVAVAWSDNRSGKEGVYLTYSLDGGRTWLKKEIRVDQDATPEQTGLSPQMIFTHDGSVVVAWEAGRVEDAPGAVRAPMRDVRVRRIDIKKK